MRSFYRKNTPKQDRQAWLFLGVVLYVACSLISWSIKFPEWHWTLRAAYVIGGIIAFFKTLD